MSGDSGSSYSRATYLLQRAKSAAPSFRYKSPMPATEPKLQRQQTIVLHADENRPLQSFRGSTESLHPMNAHYGSQQDLSSSNMPSYRGNLEVPQTARNLAGNNIRFQSASFRFNNRDNVEGDQLAPMLAYRDALRQNLTTPAKAGGGLPRMHYGRLGGAWRHIKQTNSYSNANLLFIDGTVRVDDSAKYPISQFGYPPMERQQHVYSSAANLDRSIPVAKSFSPMTWSATDELNRRPSLARYSNRYERHAKDNFAYWPRDLAYQKPQCRTKSTGTFKTWLGLSDALLKI